MTITKLEEEAVEAYMDAGDFRQAVLGVVSSTWRCEGGEIVADSYASKANIICELARRHYALNSTDILCTTCLCVAWEECNESDPGARPNSTGPGWMRCQLCQANEQLRAARANTPQGFGPEGRVN